MSTFFGYLYKKKHFRAFKHPYTHTPIHQIRWPNDVTDVTEAKKKLIQI